MALAGHIQELSEKHRKLEQRIEMELARPTWDKSRVSALKKQKLRLRDEIERLRTSLH